MPQRLEPTYREALTVAWRFVSAHSFLWLLGAITATLGEFGFTSFVGRLWRFFTDGVGQADFWWLPTSLHGLFDRQVEGIFASLALCLIAVSLVVLIVLVGIVAQGAILSAAMKFFRTKKNISFAEAWHTSVSRFWQLVSIKITEQFLLCILLFIIVSLWSVLPAQVLFFAFVRGTILVLGLLAGISVSTVSICAAMESIEQEAPLFKVVRGGIDVFRRHVLVSIELSTIFLALTTVVVGAVCIAAYLVTLVGVVLMMSGIFSGEILETIAGIALSTLLFVLAVAAIGGLYNAYVLSVWAYCYNKMRGKGIPSRIAHAHRHLTRSR
jgi:hypothetical protein